MVPQPMKCTALRTQDKKHDHIEVPNELCTAWIFAEKGDVFM